MFKLQNARADTLRLPLTAAYGQRQGSQTNNTKTVVTPTNNTFTNTTSSSSASHSLAQKAAAAAAAAQAPQSMPVGLQDPSSGNLMTNVGGAGFFGTEAKTEAEEGWSKSKFGRHDHRARSRRQGYRRS